MNKIPLPEYPGNNLLLHSVAHSDTINTVNLLDGGEADVNARNVNGCTSLHLAVSNDNAPMVRALVKYGADVNAKSYNDVGEKTPLHICVERGNYELINFLLDQGANTTIGDKRGLTALHYAARFGFTPIVQLLVTYGADINLRDANGFNAAQWAKLNEHSAIVELIGPPRAITADDYKEYKQAMLQIHQISLKKKKKKGKKKK